jgi:replicative DNA helicase
MLTAEKHLLSILIHDNEKIALMVDLGLSEAMFSECRPIYGEVLSLYHDNKDISYELLMAKLPTYVGQLADIMTDGALTVNPTIYAEQLIGSYLKNQSSKLLREAHEKLSKWKPGDHLDTITKLKNEVADQLSKFDISTGIEIIEPKELIYSRMEYYDNRNSNKIPLNPFQSGFAELDPVFETMNEEGTYIVLAARTTTGKTTLALNMGLNAVLAGKKVIMFTVEMSQNILTDRYLCLHADLSMAKLKNNMFNKEENDLFYCSAKEMMEKNNFRICSTVRRDWAKLEELAKKEHRRGNLDFLIIDYLQQFRYRHDQHKNNLKSELSEISARIQELKIHLKIPILVLVQPSREYNQNKTLDGKIMHYIKECGDIENDADIILHLKRANSEKDDGLRELWVEKNKLGKQDFKVTLDFNLSTGRFTEYHVY